jgi:LPPG:FO 2-phospho-L-lactate transferase
MNIVTLAGGVGGAKLAQGLALCQSEPRSGEESRAAARDDTLTVIVNTGDDFEWHGLTVCPDLDTVTYTLGGLANTVTGWGVADDTFETIGALQRLGVEPWFKIGDRDLATHVYRTELLRQGKTLTEVTCNITRALGIEATILPMTDDRFRTRVDTDQGVLEFQEYFVRRQWQPIIRRIFYDSADTAHATPQVISALEQADAILIAPSKKMRRIIGCHCRRTKYS